jgi:hypothetical protein
MNNEEEILIRRLEQVAKAYTDIAYPTSGQLEELIKTHGDNFEAHQKREVSMLNNKIDDIYSRLTVVRRHVLD